jgi:hypothetical protein
VLSALAGSYVGARVRASVSTAPAAGGERGYGDALSLAAGRLWANGVDLDWSGSGLHGKAAGGPHRIPLPAYPFRRTRFWIHPGSDEGKTTTRIEDRMVHEADEESRRTLLTEYVAPAGELENAVAELWQQLLGADQIGARDRFFELGGNSLLAARMVTLLAVRLGLELTLAQLFAEPTVAGVVAAARTATEEPMPVATPDPEHRHDPFPLLEMQQAQWIGRAGAFDLGGVAAQVYLELDGADIDPQRLQRAWRQVVRRHEMLRAVVLPDGRQRILPDPPAYRIPVLDLRGKGAAETEERIQNVRAEMESVVRAADTWPLWEIRLSLLDNSRVRTHIGFDLLVADVAGLFFRILPDWRRCYEADRDEPWEPPELSFRDYVLAERSLPGTPRYERALDHWRERVPDLPDAPRLPLKRPLSELVAPTFDRWNAHIEKSAWERIKHRCASRGVTPTSALLACFATVLAEVSAEPRFLLNLTAVNRLPLHSEVDDLVGEFASFDLLDVDAGAPGSIDELARRLHRQLWDDLGHNVVSGLRVLRELARHRDAPREALAPVVFTSALAQQEATGEFAPTEWLGRETYLISQTPQVLLDHFVMVNGENLDLAWHAVSEAFPDGMLNAMFSAYVELVRALADENGWSDPCRIVELAKFVTPAATEIARSPRPAQRRDELSAVPRELIDLVGREAAVVLALDQVDPMLDFFAQGGDSIMAVQLATRINTLGYELDAQAVFDATSLRSLAASVRSPEARERVLSRRQRDAIRDRTVIAVAAVDPRERNSPTLSADLRALVAAHDELRLRPDTDSDVVSIWRGDEVPDPVVIDIDLSAIPPEREAVSLNPSLVELAAEIDPCAGVPLAAVQLSLRDKQVVVLLGHRACIADHEWAGFLEWLGLNADQQVPTTGVDTLTLDAESHEKLITAALDSYRLTEAEVLVAGVVTAWSRVGEGRVLVAERPGTSGELVELSDLAATDCRPEELLPRVKDRLRMGVPWDGGSASLVIRGLVGNGARLAEIAPVGAVLRAHVEAGRGVLAGHRSSAHDSPDFSALFDALREACQDMLRHCADTTSPVFGPADFPDAELDSAQLRAFLGEIQ